MEKSKKITLLTTIILVGFVFGVTYHFALGFYAGAKPPFNSFVYPSYKAFCDFIEVLPFIKDFNPYKIVTPWIAYFPLAYIILFPFTLIKNVFLAYFLFISIFLAFFIPVNIKMFACKSFSKLQNFQNIFILTFISYPFLYAIDKGNLDLFLFILLALAIYTFQKEKYFISAVLFAFENAMKPFPILFLLLFLYKKRYKEFFLSVLLSGFLILGGFMALNGNFFDKILIFIQDIGLMKGLYYNYDNFGLTFTSSLFFPLEWLFCKVGEVPLLSTIKFMYYYNVFYKFAIIAVVYFAWREKVFWKQITLFTTSMLLLPYLIYDHKLIFLFIPLWLFVNTKEKSKFDLAYTILFALMFIPKNIIFINKLALHHPELLGFLSGGEDFLAHQIYWSFISLSVFVNPIIMLTLFTLIIIEQFQTKGAKEKNLELTEQNANKN